MRGKAVLCSFPPGNVGITPAYAGKSGGFRPRLPGRCGSPPRMRGKASTLAEAQNMMRITPAYAGKRHRFIRNDNIPEDHPRVCGEKRPRARWAIPPPGSPPRMRGKDYHIRQESDTCGITPAYAGKSRLLSALQKARLGSPPRMRGKVGAVALALDALGITPAYAGKSVFDVDDLFFGQDHPRVCGEKSGSFVQHCYASGSPPRMRGKGAEPSAVMPETGITPAYAGKRNRERLQAPAKKDHPRVCGEKKAQKGIQSTTQRITPAYAGKSATLS